MKTKTIEKVQRTMSPEASSPTTSAGSGSPEGLSPLRESPETSGPAGRGHGVSAIPRPGSTGTARGSDAVQAQQARQAGQNLPPPGTPKDSLTAIERPDSGPDPGVRLRISEVRFRFPPDQSGPLVAYASCLINGCLALNDIRIERGREHGLVVVYPSKPSASGKRHSTFNPVTREAGETLREALLGGLAGFVDAAAESDARGEGGQ